jgi:hypothetical protein
MPVDAESGTYESVAFNQPGVALLLSAAEL